MARGRCPVDVGGLYRLCDLNGYGGCHIASLALCVYDGQELQQVMGLSCDFGKLSRGRVWARWEVAIKLAR